MRTRQEINAELQKFGFTRGERIQAEILMDIRDLLLGLKLERSQFVTSEGKLSQ